VDEMDFIISCGAAGLNQGGTAKRLFRPGRRKNFCRGVFYEMEGMAV
jgi:hypothetical protein